VSVEEDGAVAEADGQVREGGGEGDGCDLFQVNDWARRKGEAHGMGPVTELHFG